MDTFKNMFDKGDTEGKEQSPQESRKKSKFVFPYQQEKTLLITKRVADPDLMLKKPDPDPP